MQGCQRIDDVHNEDIGSEDDKVHQQTNTYEVAEAIATWAIDQHVGRRTDRGSKTAADANHQGNKEGEWVIAHFLGCFVHNGEKHSTRCRIGNELGNEGADETDGF